MTTRSLDSINVRRIERPTALQTDEGSGSARRSSSGASGVVMAALLIGGAFFLATHPSADTVPTPAASLQPPTTAGALTISSEIGPPQPDQSQSLEKTVILDRPLPTSQTQNDTSDVAPSAPPTAPGLIKPDSFALRILNGGGASGAAAEQRSTLVAEGFRIVDTGTAVNSYATSIIYYTANHEEQAKLVAAAYLDGKTKLQQDEIAQPADVLLVIGADTP